MWQVAPAGDRALLVTMGRTIDPSLLGQVLALDKALAGRRLSGLISTVPAYASLLCHYDPGVTDAARLEAGILKLEGHVDPAMALGPVVDVPKPEKRISRPAAFAAKSAVDFARPNVPPPPVKEAEDLSSGLWSSIKPGSSWGFSASGIC